MAEAPEGKLLASLEKEETNQKALNKNTL